MICSQLIRQSPNFITHQREPSRLLLDDRAFRQHPSPATREELGDTLMNLKASIESRYRVSSLIHFGSLPIARLISFSTG